MIDLGFTTGANLNINPFSFTAGAYISAAGEIVISYKGTDFLTEFEGRSWNTVVDLVADVGLATTIRNFNVGQQLYASSYFLAVKDWAVQNGHDASKISFTGHSLGGGLASNMAVWFDRSATTFAQGPFEIGAKDPVAIVAAAATLTLQAGATASAAVLAEILTLQSTYDNFATREAKVTNYAIGGEFLGYLRDYVPTVMGNDIKIDVGPQPLSNGVSLHSMNLHLALLMDERLRVACLTIPELVPALLDKSLYATDPNFAKEDFVTRLVADQLQGSVTRQNGSLGKFVADILKLDVGNGMLAQPSLRTGLIAAAMEYHFFNPPVGTNALLTVTGNGIHFKYADIGVAQTGLKSPRLLATAIQPFLTSDEWATVGYKLPLQDAWHIQTGTAGMIWTASGATAFDAAIGGAQTDILDGGAGDDILIGGAAQDFLTGGANNDTLIGGVGLDSLSGGTGNDLLMGGAEADIYSFSGAFGTDIIQDSGGDGVLQVEGFDTGLPQGKKIGEGKYQSSNELVTYTKIKLSDSRTDLVITFAGRPDQITIRNWLSGQFGITLDETATPPSTTVVGDTQQSIHDSLIGTAAADSMLGLTGNDALTGGDGNDVIEGGTGADVLAGGLGSDVLNGGDGTDYIFGSGNASGAAWSDARGEWIVVSGSSWSIPGVGSPVANDQGNVIDAGAGTDWVAAGTGSDVVRAGAGGDLVYGMAGNDYVDGGDDADELHGDSTNTAAGNYNTTAAADNGNDTLVGGAGNDSIYGEGGADELYGGADNDVLDGDTSSANVPGQFHGDDYLDGGDGSDTLFGNGGADELFGGTGNDTLVGDTASDTPAQQLGVAFHGADYLDGEDGDDELYGEGGADTLFGGIGSDILLGDDNVSRLVGSAHGADYLDGEDGNDSLEGGGGADTLFGGIGADTLWGDSDEAGLAVANHGNDYLDGEDGNDQLAGNGGADTLTGGAGADLLFGDGQSAGLPASANGNDQLAGDAGNDTLYGGGGNDQLAGGADNDRMSGDDLTTVVAASAHGRDTLDGGAGNDVMFGDGGDDLLNGGDGNDWLAGEDELNTTTVSALAGNDTLNGGVGVDTLLGGNGDDLLDGGMGDDRLFGGGGSDLLFGADGVDQLTAGAGNDFVDGGAGDDLLWGDDGNDTLSGGDGNDQLDGGTGGDTLQGGSGADQLYGGDGNDVLNGGLGIDVLQGGAGDDTYDMGLDDMLIGSGGVADLIIDTQGTNTLRLAGTLAGVGVTTVGSVENIGIFVDAQHAVIVQGAVNGAVSRVEFSGSGSVSMDRLIGEKLSQTVALTTNASQARLFGGALADALSVGAQAAGAVISGGRGDDSITLASTAGATLLYSKGDGADSLTSNFSLGTTRTGTNVLRLDNGISLSDLRLQQIAGNSFRLVVGNGADYIEFALDALDRKGSSRPFDFVHFVGEGRQVDWASLIDSLAAGAAPSTQPYQLLGTLGNDTIVGDEGNDTLLGTGASVWDTGSKGNDLVYGNGGGDWLVEGAGNDILLGGAGNDYLSGGEGMNAMLGGSGNDTLRGSFHRQVDFFEGGAGNDSLSGDSGTGTFYFARGWGSDVINTADGTAIPSLHDVVIFGPGIAPSDIVVTGGDGNGLLLTLAGTSDSLLIRNGIWNIDQQIEHIQFDDGTLWNATDLLARVVVLAPTIGSDTIIAMEGQTVQGLTGNDYLAASKSGNLLDGGEGVDALEGQVGSDTLIGGRGNDSHLNGRAGSDVYVFNPGDGVDTIFDGSIVGSGDVDEIRLGHAPADVQLRRGGYNDSSLFLSTPSTGDQIEVWGWFNQDDNSGLVVKFSNGTVWNAQYIRENAVEPAGSAYQYGTPAGDFIVGNSLNNFLYGGVGNDTLNGGAGNDWLDSSGGNDVYVFGYGGGSDDISESAQGRTAGGLDTIRMDASVRPQDVVITRPSSSRTIISLANSADQITIHHDFEESTRIERIYFIDGTVWDLVSNPPGQIIGTGNADGIVGTAFDDVIDGGSGNDTLGGGTGGNDFLIGGPGNDLLHYGQGGMDTMDGGSGDDELLGAYLVIFGRGYGYDKATRGSIVEFKSGVAPSDIRLTTTSVTGTLRIEIVGTTDVLDLRSFNTHQPMPGETFIFADGTRWDFSEIDSRVDRSSTGGADYIFAPHVGNSTLAGGDGNDTLSGSARGGMARGGNDFISGDPGDDWIYGSAGVDTIAGGTGNDLLYGYEGQDVYLFNRGDGRDLIRDSDSRSNGSAGRIRFGTGIVPSDIEFSRGIGPIAGSGYSMPSDYNGLNLSIKNTSDVISLDRWFIGSDGTHVDIVEFADGTIWNKADLLARYYADHPGGEMYGSDFNDSLAGASQADRIEGLGGDDSLMGFDGNDELIGDSGNDTLDGGRGDDWLYGGVGNDTYVFGRGSGRDVIADYNRVNGGADRILLGAGVTSSDVEVTRNETDILLSIRGTDDKLSIRWYLNAGFAIESVQFQDGLVWSAANLQQMADDWATVVGTTANDTLVGNSAANSLVGLDGDDTLRGLSGDDLLEGGAGNDHLDGGTGDDVLQGGVGNDMYVVDSSMDRVIEGSGAGNDTVVSMVSWSLEENVENLTLTGTGTIGGTGNALDNTLTGNNANNSLAGGAGGDTLDGGAGNDTLDGGAGVDILNGGDGDNVFQFGRGDGQDRVNGGTAATALGSTLQFKPGVLASEVTVTNDAATGDAVIKIAGTFDQVRISGFFTAVASAGAMAVNRVTFADGTVWDVAAIVAQSLIPPGQEFIGTASADNLAGLAGNDTIQGLGGDDTLTGGAGNDQIDGGLGNDTLDGGVGKDSLVGGGGNDVYTVDDAGDTVTELASDGVDSIGSSVTYTLGANIENLTLTGVVAISGTGNTSDNALTGNGASNTLTGAAGNDTLDGGASNDLMIGGTGNDTFVVNIGTDVVTEAAGEGIDSVLSSVTLTLANNVENLTLAGATAISGTGNTLDNVLTGNSANNTLTGAAGNDTLDGGLGNDTMVGGAGNDTYTVNAATDVITEAANGGTDTVQSAVTLTLTTNVENLVLTGAGAINATGNTQSNVLTGNSAANTLSGGTGADTMAGGAGNDTYVVDNSGDVVTELAAEGADLVQSGVTYTLAANLENLTLTGTTAINATGNTLDNLLTGNSANNTLTGAAGNDTLNGGTGNDTMLGGAGNDTYVVNIGTDVVTELANEGIDTVQSGVTLTLGSNVENLALTGTSTINATGNTLDNLLTGNSANNTLTGAAGNDLLDGGLGNDTMVGGAGNDIYVVNVATDVVTEAVNEGTDTVQSVVTLTLDSNVENLTLTGTTAINGTGNTLNNVLTGNSGANVLGGAAGDDTYDGAAGNDTFSDTSTASNDTYRWGTGSGLDTLTDSGGALDHVDLFAGITKSQLKFVKNGNHLELSVTGQTDKLTINNWYVSSANQIEEFRLGDGSKVLASEVQGLLSAMAAFTAASTSGFEGGRATILPMPQRSDLVMPSTML
ncbi:MAG: hypothetical protein AD742_17785 [Methylibium sp. NZG]|nr:MAG: hypothetical protein AD742_17785 [Methylibium sp. NZG]